MNQRRGREFGCCYVKVFRRQVWAVLVVGVENRERYRIRVG